MKMHFKMNMVLIKMIWTSENDEEFQADTDDIDEQESESGDDNINNSTIPEVLTKTQEPVVFTQEEESQPQVLTQARESDSI